MKGKRIDLDYISGNIEESEIDLEVDDQCLEVDDVRMEVVSRSVEELMNAIHNLDAENHGKAVRALLVILGEL